MIKCYDCTHVEMCGWRKEVKEQGCEFFSDGIAWIPVGERLPDDDGEYLVCYEDGYREDHSLPEIGIQSFDVNCDGFGEWIDYYHPETLGFVDSDWSEIKVKAWMPLPEPYRGGDLK